MAEQAAGYLRLVDGGVYVDTTAGLGGHTGLLARQLKSGMVISLDRDAETIEKAKENTLDCADRITFRQSRFSQLRRRWGRWAWARWTGFYRTLGFRSGS